MLKLFNHVGGLDMTRRELQLASRDKGRPWDLGKDVKASYPIFASTPEGVGPLQPGDRIEGRIDGVGTIALNIGPAA